MSNGQQPGRRRWHLTLLARVINENLAFEEARQALSDGETFTIAPPNGTLNGTPGYSIQVVAGQAQLRQGDRLLCALPFVPWTEVDEAYVAMLHRRIMDDALPRRISSALTG